MDPHGIEALRDDVIRKAQRQTLQEHLRHLRGIFVRLEDEHPARERISARIEEANEAIERTDQ